MRNIVSVTFLFFILFSGCSKIDPKIEQASYIEISDFMVITDENTQGTNNHKFSNVLVSSGTETYGYFPVPGRIPIPLEGSKRLIIRPAIEVNGVKFLRVDYPMMRSCDSTFPLVKGQSLKVTPVFKYYNSAGFPIVENFEKTTGFLLVNSDPADTFCSRIDTANAYFGDKCLSLRLDATHATCQVQSSSGFTLPNTGPSVYAEFNYKSNFPVEVGLIGAANPATPGTDQRSAGGANASASWNKIYIDLTALVRTPPYYPYYFLYFYTAAGFDGNVSAPQIYIDNVKVVRQ